MNGARVLWAMVLADFRERVRRYSFLLSMGFAVYLGYAVYAGQVALQLDGYRGVNNSAWIGSVLALVASVWVSLIGFYVVKNTIQRDRETGVGQILATTPMSKWFYTLAKTVSNFAVLGTMVLILGGAAVVIALVKGEAGVEWVPLLAPLLVIGSCAVAVTAALAVLFESLPGLRGGVGNILYFFVWIGLIMIGVGDIMGEHGAGSIQSYARDYTGIAVISGPMQAQLRAMDAGFRGGVSFTVGGLMPTTKTFVWHGLHWTWELVAGRLFWVVVAAGLAGLAALFFDRFDPSSGTARGLGKMKKAATLVEEAPEREAVFASGHLTPLARSAGKSRFVALVAAELRLMVRGRSWWWALVAAGLVIGGLAAPVAVGRLGVLVAAWIWPTLIWSQMGVREAQDGTGPLIFSAAKSFPRQLLAVWVAGVLVAVMTGGGVGLRMMIAGDWQGVGAWGGGAMFIPALALALGVWTESRKPFEALYTVWWYIGPLHQIRGMDFMGTTAASSTAVQFAVAAVVLVAGACAWRRTRLAYA